MSKKNVALVGVGTWGKNILRVLNDICEVSVVCYSGSQETRKFLEEEYPGLRTTTNLQEIAQDESIEAVFIATPIAQHFAHAKLFLEYNKHLFVEKPLALKVDEVNELHDTARKNNLVLFTGYIYLYDESLKKLVALTENERGKLHTRWEKFGTFDSPIETNLLVHEIAIAHQLLGEVSSVTVKEAQKNKIELNMEHDRGTSHIYIDREVKEKSKKIAFNIGNISYELENGILLKKENGNSEVVNEFDVKILLQTECQTFIDEIDTGPAGNETRRRIDESVASVLQS